MESAPVIIFIGLLVFLSHLFVSLFDRTRIPDVLYLILIGIVIGPLFHIVTPDDFGKLGNIFTTIALVVILFEGGLELSIESLRVSLRGTLVVTFVSYSIALILLTITILIITALPFLLSLFIAAVLAGPAPAVIIPMVRQLRLTDSTKTTLTLESSFGESLCIIVALAILESLKLNEIHVGRLVGNLLSSFVFALVIGTVGGYVWSILLHRIRQLRYAIFTTPSFLFILYGITDYLGFSGPIAALAFGITLGNVGIREIPWLVKRFNLTPLGHNETEKLFFGEIVFLIKTFFFVYLGLSVSFYDLPSIASAMLICGILLLARLTSVRVSASKKITPQEDAAVMGVMIPKGTAAAVLASMPLQMGLVEGIVIQNLIYSAVVISILITAVLIFLMEKPVSSVLVRFLFSNYKKSPEIVPSEGVSEPTRSN
ncbi:MAG TPA: cation:proton antiporter [Bacteroidota bacterium]|nr:cation:proton antiporter [Bacteroidota bacterium]